MSKPILFNTEMVQAILAGTKTQTRRAIQDKFYYHLQGDSKNLPYVKKYTDDFIDSNAKYKNGDVLWVREPARVISSNAFEATMQCEYKADGHVVDIDIDDKHIDADFDDNYDGDKDYIKTKWIRECNGIPNGCIKELARIYLKVTNVRVERLQDIEHEDICSEGMNFDSYCLQDQSKSYSNDEHGEVDYCEDMANEWWQGLWNSTAKDGYKWQDNPFVFVYEFERI